MIQQAHKEVLFLFALVSISLLIYFLYPFLSYVESFSVSLTIYFLLKFADKMGTTIPLKEFISLMAVVQWLFAPLLVYLNYPADPINFMPIDRELYFELAFPSTIAYIVGLFILDYRQIKKEKKALESAENGNESYFKIGVILVIISFIADIAEPFIPYQLFFVAYLVQKLKFVGAFYIYFSEEKSRVIWFAFVFIINFILSVSTVLFHDILIVTSYAAIFYVFKKDYSFVRKLSLLLAGLFIVLLIQNVKIGLRKQLINLQLAGNNNAVNLTIEFVELVAHELYHPDKIYTPEKNKNLVTRLNQGRIIAFIYDNIPKYDSFLEGESIKDAVIGAIFPRFIMQNKVQAGGYTHFKRFTGKNLPRGTSMDISLLGEAYGNFGKWGSMFFMFATGLFISAIITGMYSLYIYVPSIAIWIPYVFLNVIKAEADFATMLNQIVKASMIAGFMIWLYHKKLLPTEEDQEHSIDIESS